METDTGITNLLIELIINVVLLISFFVVLLLAVRWRRRRNEEAQAQTTAQSSPPQQPAAPLAEPEGADLATLPQATAPQDDDELPDWINDLE